MLRFSHGFPDSTSDRLDSTCYPIANGIAHAGPSLRSPLDSAPLSEHLGTYWGRSSLSSPVQTSPLAPASTEALAGTSVSSTRLSLRSYFDQPYGVQSQSSELLPTTVVNAITIPVADAVAAPVADAIAVPVAETIAIPVADAVATPVADAIAAPVAKVATPLADAVAAPVSNAIPESSVSSISLALPVVAQSTAPPYSSIFGYGLVDAAAAVANVLGLAALPAVTEVGGGNWSLEAINAPEVWAKGYTGQGVVVAVVDSGVDYTHPDLKNNIWVNTREIAGNGLDDDHNGYIDDIVGWDYVDYDNSPLDGTGHGTHVAGTIAAELNTFGATGVAYGAKVMPVRVLDANGNGSYARIAEGVYYAVDNGANIINLSIGGTTYSAQLQAAIQYATDRGVLVISAAGNNGGVSPLFPASLASQVGIAVGAVDLYNQMPSFSARSGATPVSYVVAPGVNIFSTTPNNTYGFNTGTSMAVPHIAGVAALLLSAKPTLTPAQLTALLTNTANPTGITLPPTLA